MHLSDIAPSIFSGLGLQDAQGRSDFEPSPHGRECLLLVDGLGLDSLLQFSEYVPTLSKMIRMQDVETAFPSTTATSLTTLMTGELPGVHGMLGYTVRVPRSGGRILNSLKWDERVDPLHWQSIPTLFERGAAHGIHVSHVAAKRYESTGFTRAAFRGAEYFGANVLTEMLEKTKQSLMKSPAFTYVYINELDVAGHSDGVGSEKWLHALAHVDHVAESLMQAVPKGTRFWITSDHGMINVAEKIVIGKENSLLTGLSAIAGEPRARHLYLDDHHLSGEGSNEILAMWREFLGDRADVFSKAEAHSLGLFGQHVSADADDRMGDIIAIAKGEMILIDPERENLESMMVGHHGARTTSEKFVPLLMKVVEN